MLARDVALAKERPLLKDLVLVLAPIFNADGNELMAKNRPRQAGPELVGTRTNAQKFDLNRDFVFRPCKPEELLLRAYRILRFVEAAAAEVRTQDKRSKACYRLCNLPFPGQGRR